MKLKAALLYQLSNKHDHRNLLHKGFTLVELMIVIVIVGILSAVAIPNFLAQTEKAKATEAKASLAATLKQAQANYVESGSDPKTAIADMATDYKTPTNGTTKFNYSGAWATPVYTVTAVGNANDTSIKDKEIKGCVNMTTGIVKVSQQFGDAVDCS
jgi:type IV pilus assembly protein PilA